MSFRKYTINAALAVRQFTITSVLAGSLILSACGQEEKKALPYVRENQRFYFEPEIGGVCQHTLLTDIDGDGTWDLAQRLGEMYFKKGFGPKQSVGYGVEINFVEPEFFDPYQ